MTDSLRSERPAAAGEPERERDARVEQFLLSGLDHYFAGRFEQAINVWTRVLFINHGHARARAYIERARSAIAERQRESDELLHTGLEAVRRGDTTAARRLLTSAAERGAEPDQTLAALARVQRLESAAGARSPRAGRRAAAPAASSAPAAPAPPRSRPWATGVLVAAAVFLALVLAGSQVRLPQEASRQAIASRTPDPLPVPTRAGLRLEAARAQQAAGHLREALAALAEVEPTDANWGEAEALRALIQQQLLSGAGTPVSSGPGSERDGSQP